MTLTLQSRPNPPEGATCERQLHYAKSSPPVIFAVWPRRRKSLSAKESCCFSPTDGKMRQTGQRRRNAQRTVRHDRLSSPAASRVLSRCHLLECCGSPVRCVPMFVPLRDSDRALTLSGEVVVALIAAAASL